MYDFLRLQYQLGKITEARLQTAVDKGYITAEQMTEILEVAD
ncbi:MAG TPA: XkdX family protein [Syntrophomonas sp.]|nr:XkdX family protein [Syntrophomonas sp.]